MPPQAANSSPDDFLLLFPPEVFEEQPVAEPKTQDPPRREVLGAPQPVTPVRESSAHSSTRDSTTRPANVPPPRIRESSGVRQVGINVSPIGFIFGVAVGAFGMWMFSVSPSLHGATAVAYTAPSTPVFSADSANAEFMPGDVSPTPGPTAPVPAEPTPIAASDAFDRQEIATAAAPRVSELREEELADETPTRQFTGSLALLSGPPGARAFVNGKPVGSTPVFLSGLPVGSRVVRIEAEGYQTWSAAIRVVADEQTRVNATLYRDPPRP